jgi:putative addiction module killer protein
LAAQTSRRTGKSSHSDSYPPVSLGNFGDSKPLGEGVSELRIDYGPGYRVYFHRIGNSIVLLLVGGTKKTQDADIAKAKKLAKEAQNGS